MLRADNVICGTSTTGTGTLTLAACPAPPGGLDFDKWLKATGFNFVSGNAVLVSYTLIEYTSSAFTTAKQIEKGVGTLTLGASITAATLARTTVQSISTGLDTSTPAPTFAAPTAITIGTAANVLVFVGGSVADIVATQPYVLSGFGDGNGVCQPGLFYTGGSVSLTNSGSDYYLAFNWTRPLFVKRATIVTGGVTLSGSTASAYGRLYDVGTDGKPGRLLYDFGQIGSSTFGSSSFAAYSSGAAGNGFWLYPGEYWFDLALSWTGGTGNPSAQSWGNCGGNWCGGYAVTSGVATSPSLFSATGATIGAAPATANTTSFAIFDSHTSAIYLASS